MKTTLAFVLLFALLVVAPMVPPVAAPAAAQDFATLQELHAADRDTLLERRITGTPRVLIAGDSWAQFMWDDGVHDAVLRRFGLGDLSAVSLSLGETPDPGYTGPEYAVSGSEARQWADTASYPFVDNVVAALQANPTIDHVVLSLGGNDILAGRSDGGWYKDMDLDVPGSEAALFERIRLDTFVVIDALLAVRPDLRVVLSSYDYPNFDVGFWCFLFACPKRRDLSRDPTNDLITDAELNALMIDVETRRRTWAAETDRVLYDNSIGLMHHVYGDGASGPRALPRPGIVPPDYGPFPGGNPLLPTLRDNFRLAGGLDADPIHLTPEGYRHKAGQQMAAHLFRGLVGTPDTSLVAVGGDADGWTDGVQVAFDELSVGDDGVRRVASIVRFDTTILPADMSVTGATLWLTRTGLDGTNPFAVATPRVDVSLDGFGTPGVVEPGDLDAPATDSDAGAVVGSVFDDGDALRIDLDPAVVGAFGSTDFVELRVAFDTVDVGASRVVFADGSAGSWMPTGVASYADTRGSAAPVLELQLEVGTDAPAAVTRALVLEPVRPNPFNPRTSIVFELARASSHVMLDVYDTAGRHVRSLHRGALAAGRYERAWNGTDGAGRVVASGVYRVRLRANGVERTTRAVLVR